MGEQNPALRAEADERSGGAWMSAGRGFDEAGDPVSPGPSRDHGEVSQAKVEVDVGPIGWAAIRARDAIGGGPQGGPACRWLLVKVLSELGAARGGPAVEAGEEIHAAPLQVADRLGHASDAGLVGRADGPRCADGDQRTDLW